MIGVLLALIVAAPMALGQDTVLSGQAKETTATEQAKESKASGQARQLATSWWQWALAKPLFQDPPVNPLEGAYTDGSQCDGKPVTDTKGKEDTNANKGDKSKREWFLAGSLATDPLTRTCTVPVGTKLFFPVVNQVAFKTEPTDTEQSLRKQNSDFMASVLDSPDTKTLVEVDGKEVPSKRLIRADTALFSATQEFLGSDPVDAVGDGLWVSLPPLSKGQHTVHFGVSASSADTDPAKEGPEGFTQDITYTLKVVPGKG